jgi:RNA polymerase sigma-70 factor (ECF subfamily)
MIRMMQDPSECGHDSREEATTQTWSALLCRSIPLIYGTFTRRGIHPALAEELTQKTVFDAVRGRTAFDPLRGTLEQWILGIAHKNLALEMRRRTERAKVSEQLSASLHLMERELLPDELLERKETAHMVRLAMARLPDRERLVLELKYLHDFKVRDIAGRMKTSEKAVHSLLYRARIQLRDRLKVVEPLLREEPNA